MITLSKFFAHKKQNKKEKYPFVYEHLSLANLYHGSFTQYPSVKFLL